jgi:hypothetical protein
MTTSEVIEKCPICFAAPSVQIKPVGSLDMWVAGCDFHFKDLAIQPTREEVVRQWNDVVGHLDTVGAH